MGPANLPMCILIQTPPLTFILITATTPTLYNLQSTTVLWKLSVLAIMDFINKLAGGDNDNNNNGGGNSGNNQYNNNNQQRNDDQYSNNQRNDDQYGNNNNNSGGSNQSGGGGFLNSLTNNNSNNNNNNNERNDNSEGNNQSGGGGFLDGLKNKMNTAAGGGRESEKNEDMLDKGIDFVQERFMGQGKQDNESAIEQAKDEQISDFIRGQYKGATGSDMPIKDKNTTFN
ncbi:hypothetical protein V493_06002 [Pseudogymnoascus sp. VKM F-4281 (FW-2241)]|nr:hypothetical protein V493_06002 [Pseudogymnoascus sp. VKM F-4281 (FW-2241)]